MANLSQSIRLLLRLAYEASPLLLLTTLGTGVIASVASALRWLGVRWFTDGLVGHDLAWVWSGIALTAVLSAVSFVGESAAITALRMELEERIRLHLDQDILRLTAALPYLEHHERADYADRLALLREDQFVLSQPIGPLVFLLFGSCNAVTTLALLGSVHPALMLLPLAGIPRLIASHFAHVLFCGAEGARVGQHRMANELLRLGTTAASGKEVRTFGIARFLTERFTRLQGTFIEARASARWRGAVFCVVGDVILTVTYAGAVLAIAYRAALGQSTFGDLVMVLMLWTAVASLIAHAAGNTQWLGRVVRATGRYIWLLDYARRSADSPGKAAPPPFIEHGIRFEGVTFCYPNTQASTLRNVNLFLPAGSTVALIGDNGAGKSTIVKLLCRFYEPTEGRITVDGVDIASFDLGQWRSRMTGAFQDFARFEFRAQEAIGVGDLELLEDSDAVRQAAARAGAADVITTLPEGLSTQLGRDAADGRELSGGEWQKLALGRAMMRTAPLVLALDEPTASLDAESEEQLFGRYAEGAATARGTAGAITLLVSHRFSTVRMADTIVVLENGHVVESGVHAALMRTGGPYSQLYSLQAHGYR